MLRRPPRSTRTDTIFPYTTLFRSVFLPAPPTQLPATSSLRVAVLPCVGQTPLSFEARNTLDQVAAALEPHCGPLEWLYPDQDVEALRALHAKIMRYELARGLLPIWRAEPRALSAVTVEAMRSEEHTSELQSLMRRSYAVFCLKKKN